MAGEGTTEAEHDLLARLDRAFAHQRRLDPAILASIRAWQRTDRTYEMVQDVVREREIPIAHAPLRRTALRVGRHLHDAILSGRLPFELRVFRGLRDIMDGLGVSRPPHALGRRIDLSGFCATTVFRDVAADEFTARRGVLLDLLLPVGTPALWIAGIGDTALRRQGELLLGVATTIHVYSHGCDIGPTPVLKGKVVPQ